MRRGSRKRPAACSLFYWAACRPSARGPTRSGQIYCPKGQTSATSINFSSTTLLRPATGRIWACPSGSAATSSGRLRPILGGATFQPSGTTRYQKSSKKEERFDVA